MSRDMPELPKLRLDTKGLFLKACKVTDICREFERKFSNYHLSNDTIRDLQEQLAANVPVYLPRSKADSAEERKADAYKFAMANLDPLIGDLGLGWLIEESTLGKEDRSYKVFFLRLNVVDRELFEIVVKALYGEKDLSPIRKIYLNFKGGIYSQACEKFPATELAVLVDLQDIFEMFGSTVKDEITLYSELLSVDEGVAQECLRSIRFVRWGLDTDISNVRYGRVNVDSLMSCDDKVKSWLKDFSFFASVGPMMKKHIEGVKKSYVEALTECITKCNEALEVDWNEEIVEARSMAEVLLNNFKRSPQTPNVLH